jgi:hypothetical protein
MEFQIERRIGDSVLLVRTVTHSRAGRNRSVLDIDALGGYPQNVGRDARESGFEAECVLPCLPHFGPRALAPLRLLFHGASEALPPDALRRSAFRACFGNRVFNTDTLGWDGSEHRSFLAILKHHAFELLVQQRFFLHEFLNE